MPLASTSKCRCGPSPAHSVPPCPPATRPRAPRPCMHRRSTRGGRSPSRAPAHLDHHRLAVAALDGRPRRPARLAGGMTSRPYGAPGCRRRRGTRATPVNGSWRQPKADVTPPPRIGTRVHRLPRGSRAAARVASVPPAAAGARPARAPEPRRARREPAGAGCRSGDAGETPVPAVCVDAFGIASNQRRAEPATLAGQVFRELRVDRLEHRARPEARLLAGRRRASTGASAAASAAGTSTRTAAPPAAMLGALRGRARAVHPGRASDRTARGDRRCRRSHDHQLGAERARGLERLHDGDDVARRRAERVQRADDRVQRRALFERRRAGVAPRRRRPARLRHDRRLAQPPAASAARRGTASQIRTDRLPCATAAGPMRTSPPITTVPVRSLMTTRAGSPSIDRQRLEPRDQVGTRARDRPPAPRRHGAGVDAPAPRRRRARR